MRQPLLYECFTRVQLEELALELGRPATLDDLPDRFFEALADQGFDWLWLLGVWQTGELGPDISRASPDLRAAWQRVLPGFRETDICGSPFAIQAYDVHRQFGGPAALARLRRRLARHNLRLMLDFVPNHVAPDHPWVERHPEFFIHGSEADLAREPQNFLRLQTRRGQLILAHGRDPYSPAWADTLQLNYRHPALRLAMLEELDRVAGQCDGARCDMAMLVQPEVFLRTWGDRARPADGAPPDDQPFWPAAISHLRRRRPRFLLLAEVYWDLEWELQQAGFDFTYDKRLYDRLRSGAARPVREHLQAAPEFQEHSLRFVENHDEPRAAEIFGPRCHAAAAVALLAPGMRLVYDGQLEGRRAPASLHLRRRLPEAADPATRDFYARLLQILKRPETRAGHWRLWNCRPAWDGNPTWDQFIVFSWTQSERRLLAAVNYGPARGQCRVTLDWPEVRGRTVVLHDLLAAQSYPRSGDDLTGQGLYLELPPWGIHLFDATSATP